MKRTLVVWVLLAPLWSSALAAPRSLPRHASPPRTPAHLDAVPGEVLVASEGDAPLSLAPGGPLAPRDPALAVVLARHGLEAGEPLGVPPRSSTWRFLRLRSARADFDPRQAAADLRATGAFRAVSPNYRLALLATLPNDTYLGYQWYVDSGSGVDIRLPLAWDVQKGSASVVIAILDTGVDTGHPDLASKLWHNPGEIPGNGIDDDGNGYVDDDRGWDFGDGDNDPDPTPIFDPDYGIDVAFHGTFCAGIAAAATDNAEGIAGAGWNCRVMALKASDAAGDFTTAALTGGFEYAAAMGASVLSMSFGGPGDPGVPEYFQALVDMANAAGVVCVAAAGNDGTNALVYPAACQHVTAVAATDEYGDRASFSNWGSYVDVAAPGASMWSAINRNYPIDDWSAVFYEYLWGWDDVNPYMYGDGTSFACPLTAGVAGLIRSFLPGLTPQQVAARLVETGDAVAFDEPIGPRVNAFNAVNPALLAVAAREAPLRLAVEANMPNPFRDATTLRLALPQAGRARLAIYDCAGRAVRTLLDGPLPAGRRDVSWDGSGSDGRSLPGGIYFARLECAGRSVERKLVRLGR
jgi:subtilisin family serine protease